MDQNKKWCQCFVFILVGEYFVSCEQTVIVSKISYLWIILFQTNFLISFYSKHVNLKTSITQFRSKIWFLSKISSKNTISRKKCKFRVKMQCSNKIDFPTKRKIDFLQTKNAQKYAEASMKIFSKGFNNSWVESNDNC